MQGPNLAEIGLATGPAGATLLFSILAQRLASRPSELWSEALCWTAIGAAARCSNRRKTSPLSAVRPAPKTLWVSAVGICMASLYKTELGVIGFFPALALLVLLSEQRIASELCTSIKSDSKFSAVIKSTWGTLLLSVVFVGTLVNWDFRHSILSLFPVFALLPVYSQSYTDARDEYRRRYNAEPPPGFEAWYEFAESHQSPIIDEFDTLNERIAPFWRLSGREIQGIISRAQDQPGGELWSCNFNGHRAFLQCTHPHRTFDRHLQLLFNTLLGNLLHVLPDVTFLVNHIDEPRVLLPRINHNSPDMSSFNTTNMSRRPVWDALTAFCSTWEPRRMDGTKSSIDTFGLPFVTNAKSALDLCRHPEYKHIHGLTVSPMSFNLIEGLVPVLSTGSLSTMGDILYPSPAYIEPEFRYDEEHDIAWEDKRNNLYWAGSTTGGFAADGQRGQWQKYHRQRFVSLAQNLGDHDHEYLHETAGDGDSGTVSRLRSSFFNGRLFDVGFTRIFQCARTACRDQRMHFGLRPWADKDAALQSRLAFDLDGNGISGRYYKLLASRSAPLKQTLLREWHDDRLVPWVHYFPVSQTLRELPELVSYLTSSPGGAGQKAAQAVADNGCKWFRRAFREVDMTIYTYRLLLELARLQDPQRPAGEVHLVVQKDEQKQ
ncbi:capsule associated protein [Grosmannia clavigera kw1407]|uniref:Capsule associated protein n=1 Tax=Grosmannia clavigera (strain kw1407 / UAMH 11150) TaxID=655863 RepID=F0XKM6_GROCL|nr:capsule associated protein [Grosmannia clavigera kw1407]EFX01711.1 capsule associated protein [Grosmannia clavigera kw1407]